MIRTLVAVTVMSSYHMEGTCHGDCDVYKIFNDQTAILRGDE